MMPELFMADAVGATGKPLIRVHTAGSVGGSTAIVAASLVQSGKYKRVLTMAWEKQSESNAMWALSIPVPFTKPVGAGAGGYFAPHVRSYIRRSGAPTHIGAMVAVKDRLNGAKNPLAHLHQPDITLEKVMESQMLWDPIRFDETCPSSDGACALVIGNEEHRRRARRRRASRRLDPRHRAAHRTAGLLRAATRSTRRPAATPPRRCGATPESAHRSTRSTSPRSTCRSPGSNRCGWRTSASPRRARAGSSPRPARRRSAAASRSTPSGGVLSSNPIGASGMIRFAESAIQVMGKAGDHQVAGRPQGARPRVRRRLAVLLDVGGWLTSRADKP